MFHYNGQDFRVEYAPAESLNRSFGGNSNWRGPVWLCMHYLFVESLERLGNFYGKEWKVEYPTGSGKICSFDEITNDLWNRMVSLFLPSAETGLRPCMGNSKLLQSKEYGHLVHFHEYFHGDNGRGCGASHQTGWSALVLNALNRVGEMRISKKP